MHSVLEIKVLQGYVMISIYRPLLFETRLFHTYSSRVFGICLALHPDVLREREKDILSCCIFSIIALKIPLESMRYIIILSSSEHAY